MTFSRRLMIEIICGKGSNGADGIRIGQILHSYGFTVHIIIVASLTRNKPNEQLLEQVLSTPDISVSFIKEATDIKHVQGEVILIDALLGNGLNRPLEGTLKEIVDQCNLIYRSIIAVDLPSGLGDPSLSVTTAMKCDYTFGFEQPKLAYFYPTLSKYVGEWHWKSIGLNFPISPTCKDFLIEKNDIKKSLIGRKIVIHKGHMGRVLHIINGDYMYGAGILSAKGCLASGAGITYGYVLEGADLYDPEIAWISSISSEALANKDVICVGPGLGTSDTAVNCLSDLLEQNKDFVLDADALNIVSANGWVDRLPPGSILTPHIGEFDRLCGPCDSHHDRLEKQRALSQRQEIYIILKSAYTTVTSPSGQMYYNATGNPSRATGGTGDVLAGMVSAFIAQGINKAEACYSAVYCHGLAADLWLEDHDEHTLTPLALLPYIDKAFTKVR